MKYLDVYVMISPARGENYEVSAKSAAGGEGNSELTLPFRLGELPASIFGGDTVSRGMSVGAVPNDRLLSVETVGVELFEALFSGETRDVLSRTEDVAKRSADKTGVRIRLSMNIAAEGMAEVASLPWELMRRRNQNPLVVSVNTPVVRAFDTAIPVYLQPITGKLKVLLLVSNPKDTPQLNLAAEKTRICKIWDELENIEYVECRPEAQAVLDTLSQTEFHVVHYMGHGEFDSGSGGQVIMEGPDGSEQPISGNIFASWLQDEPLRMVFLNACNTGTTGQQSGLHPFAGVASALIGSGVPSVVAMQFPISDDAAIVFAETFYKRIAQGLPVEQAVSEGRKCLLDRQGSEWATPVLYMRAADGDLFDRSVESPPPVAVEVAVPHPVAAPQSLLSAEPAPTPATVAKPWYKKPILLGGVGIAALVFVAVLAMSGDPEPEPTPAAAQVQPLKTVQDAGNPAVSLLAAVDPAMWINDPKDELAQQVLDGGATPAQIRALADAGDGKAAYAIGTILWAGLGDTPKNQAEAAGYLEAAANQGIPVAEHFTGYNYAIGVPAESDAQGKKFPGLPKDEAKAKVLLKRAIAHGSDGAWEDLKDIFFEIVVVSDKTTPDPANPAYQAIGAIEARRWVNDQATGNPPLTIADEIIQSNSRNAIALLATGGYAKAAYVYGRLAYEGLGKVPYSTILAAQYFQQAAKAGIPEAMFYMGMITASGAAEDEQGPAIERNDDLAKAWFAKAAELGNPAAADELRNYDARHPPA